MDPNQAFDDFIQALDSDDHAGAESAWHGLRTWILLGGFLPHWTAEESATFYNFEP